MREHGFSEEDWERADYYNDQKADRVAEAEERAARKAAALELLEEQRESRVRIQDALISGEASPMCFFLGV